MALRFSCTCGAMFEVSEEYAGRQGRCRRCGKDIAIPNDPETGASVQIAASSEALLDASVSDPGFSKNESNRSLSTVVARFCPFCGKETPPDPLQCPHCLKTISRKAPLGPHGVRLSTADWILVTILAPVGLVGGFVNLVQGNRKGLAMMAISTASILIVWIVSVATGLVR